MISKLGYNASLHLKYVMLVDLPIISRRKDWPKSALSSCFESCEFEEPPDIFQDALLED
ncbi:hypothetical protein C1H46_005683 [Malus baccata]|uniref:Uncharacterized protein n=1 Tax=Malus baccata TaxID=106549 RepID=A0A540NCD7_MALBA|nr:hypothetical protein C1H46_005683 [Malus baccata]